MNYEEIKKSLNEVGELVNAGMLREADKKVRKMLGQGLTRSDLDANLTHAQIAALRKHAKKWIYHGKRD